MGLLKYHVEDSGHVQHIEYDPGTLELGVTFKNGAKYTYAKVPHEAFTNFTLDTSAGKFYHQVIRRNYSLKQEKE